MTKERFYSQRTWMVGLTAKQRQAAFARRLKIALDDHASDLRADDEYSAALKEMIERDGDERIGEFFHHYQPRAREIPIWRSIVLPRGSRLQDVEYRSVGQSWSFAIEKAYPWGEGDHPGPGAREQVYVLEAAAAPKDIDWDASFSLAFEHFAEEGEAVLIPTAVVRVDRLYQLRPGVGTLTTRNRQNPKVVELIHTPRYPLFARTFGRDAQDVTRWYRAASVRLVQPQLPGLES